MNELTKGKILNVAKIFILSHLTKSLLRKKVKEKV